MPYICLATDNIPDGVLQVLDLSPNTSQRNASIDPPGQTRYINRVQNQPLAVNATSGLTTKDARGLTAYLVAKVEPLGLTQATATVTVANAAAADTVTIAGVVFTAVNGVPNAALRQWRDVAGTGSNANTATSLAAAINNAAGQALITAAIGGGVTVTASALAAVVTLTLSSTGSADVADATLATSNNARLAKSGAYLALAVGVPSAAAYADAAADLIARVDAGESLEIADVNTVLSASLGGSTELTDAGGSRSAGSLAELLDLLAGRGFSLDKGTAIFTTPDTAPVWTAGTSRGSFTASSQVYDTQMQSGELAPVAIGGDAETREIKPVRATQDSGYFQASLQSGHLYQLQNGVTLFPDSDVLPFHATLFQKSNQSSVSGRVVTVYNNDGTLA